MESDAKLKKQSSLARLFEYAGNYKYLTILSWIFSVVSVLDCAGTVLLYLESDKGNFRCGASL